MWGRARKRAAAVLREVAAAFEGLGYQATETADSLRLRLEADGRPPLRLVLQPTGGRVFGGTFALEVSSAEPLFPSTAGVAARGRGLVRLNAIEFRGRAGDPRAARLADHLQSDRSLNSALCAVHFEQVRIDPAGRPVIRHMGGSLVWILFPPMVRPIPLVPEQVTATIAAMEAFMRTRRAMDDGPEA